jgi:hypothetical protein
MPRPLSPRQAAENAAFLAELRRTGNARSAAEALGLNRSMLTKRRAKHSAFAADWDAALAFANATLPSRKREGSGEGLSPTPEPQIAKTPSGRLQLRRSPPGRLTREGEQRFLAALSATANVRLSAAAAGFSHATFYARRRASPAFAREMRLALQCGYDRIEAALLESQSPASHADDAWRHNDPPPIPKMTVAEALHLLQLHQTEARLQAEPAHIKRRRGESAEAHSFRLAAMYEAAQARAREAFDIAEAERLSRGEGPWFKEGPALPALDQVTGWRKEKKRPPRAG